MPAQDRDVSDLERRVTQVEKTLERISERATRREEDWGTVRSKADKVDDLRNEIRELRRLMNRPAEASPVESTMTAPPPAPAAPEPSTQSIVEAVIQQLKGEAIPTSRADAVALVRQVILQDDKVRQALATWLVQELQKRGFRR